MAKWRVMTVDDSAAILTIIAAYLEDSEFEVIAAERDGIMAVERFAQERPDIVLLDLIMPIRGFIFDLCSRCSIRLTKRWVVPLCK